MTAAAPLPALTGDERLARFITVDKWVRADQTVRQDAFIPPRDLNLSVTRHVKLTELELWKLGRRVADAVSGKQTGKLYGRADITVRHVLEQNLLPVPFPLEDNPNHAHVTGWPQEKPAQKILAIQLATAAGKCVPAPDDA
jgi:hypothetical protein